MSTFNTFHFPTAWFLTLALACTLTSATVLAASAEDELRTAVVSYADLDLSKSAGVDVLYRRIDQAARKVCAPLASTEFRRLSLWRHCQREAVANAVASMNRPMLTALHRSKTRAFG